MHSRLELRTGQAAGGATVLQHCFYTPPVKILTLPGVETAGWPQTLAVMQMSASPGLLSGDRLDSRICLAEHTRLNLFTQAFTRIQSMPADGLAVQTTQITLAEGSRLTYLPHPLVLHRDAALEQTTDIVLNDNCLLMMGEIFACGRVLTGECWQFRYLSSHLRIRYRNRLLLHDNTQWHPGRHDLTAIGQMEHYSHQAVFYCIDTGVDESGTQQRVGKLHQALLSLLPPNAENCLWGVSRANEYTVCLRALGCQAQPLQDLLLQAALCLRSA